MNPDMAVMAAGFDEQHAMAVGFGEPVGGTQPAEPAPTMM